MDARLDGFATDEEVDAVASVLSEYGIDGEVAGGFRKLRYGELTGEADEPEWVIVLVLSGTFGGFLAGFFGEAGKDAWKRLKVMVKELRGARREPTGPAVPPSPPRLGSVYIRDQYGNELGFGVYPDMEGNDFWKAWETIHEPDWSALGGWHVMRQHGQWIGIEPLPGKGTVVRWDPSAGRWEPTKSGGGQPLSDDGVRPLIRKFFRRWSKK